MSKIEDTFANLISCLAGLEYGESKKTEKERRAIYLHPHEREKIENG